MFAASGEQLSAFLPLLKSSDQPVIDALRKELALPKSEYDELYQNFEANKPPRPPWDLKQRDPVAAELADKSAQGLGGYA